MININETTVAVETSAELKTVLEGANEITKTDMDSASNSNAIGLR